MAEHSRVRAYAGHLLALTLSALHHADHVVRGQHVGWPFTPDVNTFTYTLAIYPVVLSGFVLRSARYWLFVVVSGLLLLGGVHFGPFAIEPPADILSGYASPAIGVAALGVLLALVATLFVLAVIYARAVFGRKATQYRRH